MDLAGGIATAFSDSVSGLQSFGTSLASTLLSTVGDLAIKLGNIVLASGLGIQALEVSLRSFTGLPAIAAGLGLLAIGGIAKGAVTNLGRGGAASAAISSPTPTNYGQNSNRTQKIVVEVVSRLRASDLVAVGRGDAYRNWVRN